MKEDLILRLPALPDSLCLDLLSAAAHGAEAWPGPSDGVAPLEASGI